MMTTKLGIAFACALSLCLSLGCQGQMATSYDGAYRTTPRDPRRDTEKAQRGTAKAVEYMQEGKLKDAEQELKDALAADIFFGPVHNNLGVVYQRQENFYLAAWEFQYAAKLMPGKAEPRNNLGMVYEAVGRPDESAKWYDEAIALEPENVEVTANLARVLVKTNGDKVKLRKLLDDIVMKDPRQEWVEWAKEQRSFLGRPESAPELPPRDQVNQP